MCQTSKELLITDIIKCWGVEYPAIPLVDMTTVEFDKSMALIIRG